MKEIIILLLMLNILTINVMARDEVIETYNPYKTVHLYEEADRVVAVKVIDRKTKKYYKNLDDTIGYKSKKNISRTSANYLFEIESFAVKFEVLQSHKGNDKQGKNFSLNTYFNNPYDSGNGFLESLNNEDIVIIFMKNNTVTKHITTNSEESALEVMNKIVSGNYIDAGSFSISQTIAFEEQELANQLHMKFGLSIDNNYPNTDELGSYVHSENIKPIKIIPIVNN